MVRLPVLRKLECRPAAELACKLSGANLFLVQSVSSDADFTHAVEVPDAFQGIPSLFRIRSMMYCL